MELIEPSEGGVTLRVRAQPGGRQNGIRGVRDGQLLVSVTQIAEKGKANRAIVEVLAKGLGLKRSQLELVSGAASQEKKFQVTGIDAATLQTRIEREIAGSA